ncbi:MAG: 30S ribosomal protein S18 [Lachnospiraceae bacterium]|nr:30S ribosomal protein S18 [Lachnospiraceae bacterium]
MSRTTCEVLFVSISSKPTICYLLPAIIYRCISERGKILPRRVTGTCAAHQHALTTAINRLFICRFSFGRSPRGRFFLPSCEKEAVVDNLRYFPMLQNDCLFYVLVDVYLYRTIVLQVPEMFGVDHEDAVLVDPACTKAQETALIRRFQRLADVGDHTVPVEATFFLEDVFRIIAYNGLGRITKPCLFSAKVALRCQDQIVCGIFLSFVDGRESTGQGRDTLQHVDDVLAVVREDGQERHVVMIQDFGEFLQLLIRKQRYAFYDDDVAEEAVKRAYDAGFPDLFGADL